MEWLAQNWVWLLFAIAMIGMHMFGHGGHGGHGDTPRDDRNPASKEKHSGHQH